MRLLLIGASSFIAGHVVEAAIRASFEVIQISHSTPLSTAMRGADAAVNFAVSPHFFCEPYSEEHDYDRRAALAAASAGIPIVMLSTRRVYSPEQQWNAVDKPEVLGDRSIYGRNKALAERAVSELTQGQCLILRLSNVFGFEYAQTKQRKNFFAMLLSTLRDENVIRFDMHPSTRRDFIPVEICAEEIVKGIMQRMKGVFNLGSGFPTACGDLAAWVMEGFGGGQLIVTRDEARDEFFLNMDKWHGKLPPVLTKQSLKDYTMALGRRLKNA